MQLTKFEQSGFILETESGFRLAMDIGYMTPVEKLADVRCDAMVVSHVHGDHFSPEQIRTLSPNKLYLNRECIDMLGEVPTSIEVVEVHAGETLSAGDVTIEIFTVDHGPHVAAPLKDNFGFLVTADSKKIYFAGDMYFPSGIDVSLLEVDYALIPVGGYYTFGPQEAFDFVKQFKKIGKVVSMHYERNSFIDPARHEEFLALAQDRFVCE